MSRSHDPREAHFPQTASLLPRAATAPARVNSVHRSRHSSSGCRRGDPARRARARVRQRHRSAREGEPGARSQLRSARPWDDFSPRASVERALSRLVTACVGAPWSRRPREVNGGGHRPRPTRRSISAAVVTLIACSEPSTSSRALTMRSSMRARSTARASPRASIRRPAQARPSGGAVLCSPLPQQPARRVRRASLVDAKVGQVHQRRMQHDACGFEPCVERHRQGVDRILGQQRQHRSVADLPHLGKAPPRFAAPPSRVSRSRPSSRPHSAAATSRRAASSASVSSLTRRIQPRVIHVSVRPRRCGRALLEPHAATPTARVPLTPASRAVPAAPTMATATSSNESLPRPQRS